MVRIFLPLAFVSTASLLLAMGLGFSIEDPKVRSIAVQAGVQYHFLAALAALAGARWQSPGSKAAAASDKHATHRGACDA